jgi:hypothetical protein
MAEKILIFADSFIFALAAICPPFRRWLEGFEEAVKDQDEHLNGIRPR